MTLTGAQVQRYSRHLLLPQVGKEGQERLLAGAVLIAFPPEAQGTAEALAAYLAAAGVGRIGWWPLGPPVRTPGSLAGLLGAFGAAGPADAVRAINPDARLEVLGGEAGARRWDGRVALLIGGAEALAGMFRAAGMAVIRGERRGLSGAVLGAGAVLGEGAVPADDRAPAWFGESEDEALPTAPAEGALGALLAAAAIRALLEGGRAGSAGFDFGRGRLWGRAAAAP
ncbi:MAG: hypothetical protein AABZ64_04165 [Nitrospinota bacterium]